MGSEQDEPTGLRERKNREMRIALVWAAIRLAAERGLDNVRVADIAAEVGVSSRTFNNYFASKGEAIAARHLDLMQQLAAELRVRPISESLWEAVTSAAMAQSALGSDRYEHGVPDRQWLAGVRLMMTESAVRTEIVNAGVAAQPELAAAVAERTGTEATRELYPCLVASVVDGTIQAVMQHWLRTDPPEPIAPLLREALRQVATGLPVPSSSLPS